MAININGEMRDLINGSLDDGYPGIVGTASKDGVPQISMKGSLAVYDDETISYWERAKRTAMDNVSENPNVVIFYRNTADRLNWRFQGTATVYESGEIWDKVLSITPQRELDRDPERTGVAVLVKVNKITDLSGNVMQER